MDRKQQNLEKWNTLKQITEENSKKVYFKERDIFWLKVGENIGFEQNGKGNKFQRPVLVVKKYTNDMFLGIPLSTTPRDGSFFFQFSFKDNDVSTALLVQQKLFSSKRCIKKIGKINKEDFKKLKQKLYDLIFDEDFCPSKEGTIPKENCK
jgi:mRNA interferase MazF